MRRHSQTVAEKRVLKASPIYRSDYQHLAVKQTAPDIPIGVCGACQSKTTQQRWLTDAAAAAAAADATNSTRIFHARK